MPTPNPNSPKSFDSLSNIRPSESTDTENAVSPSTSASNTTPDGQKAVYFNPKNGTPTSTHTPDFKPSKISFSVSGYWMYFIFPILAFLALFINQWFGLLLFWIVSLVGVKLKPNLAWILVAVVISSLVIIFPIQNYLTITSIILTLITALFLGVKPHLSKFNKFITVTLALIIGLWITIPMSQLGTVKYFLQEYQTNSLFKNSVDSLYVGAGSPKLSPSEIEASFKAQISTEIANSIKSKTDMLPVDISKVSELCSQLGAEQNLNQNCQEYNQANLDKSVDSMVTNQVETQTNDLKNQFNQYPQVQMVQHFLNGLNNNSNYGFLTSPYFISSIILFVIYITLSGFLWFVSWPIFILLKRLSLS